MTGIPIYGMFSCSKLGFNRELPVETSFEVDDLEMSACINADEPTKDDLR
jgi:hypothetical protein